MYTWMGLPRGTSGKESTYQSGDIISRRFHPWVGKIPWRRTWQFTPIFLPGESYGQRSLASYSAWDRKASNRTEAT